MAVNSIWQTKANEWMAAEMNSILIVKYENWSIYLNWMKLWEQIQIDFHSNVVEFSHFTAAHIPAFVGSTLTLFLATSIRSAKGANLPTKSFNHCNFFWVGDGYGIRVMKCVHEKKKKKTITIPLTHSHRTRFGEFVLNKDWLNPCQKRATDRNI